MRLLFIVVSNVLYELMDINHSVFYVHRAGVAHSGHYEALVKPQVVDGAEGESKVGHLLRGQIS